MIWAAAICLITATIVSPSFAGGPEQSWVVHNKYIVDFKDDIGGNKISTFLHKYKLSFYHAPFWRKLKMEIVTIPNYDTINEIEKYSEVEGVEPLTIVRALDLVPRSVFMGFPNDPLLPKQWGMENIGADLAWKYSIGRGVTVAVVDTGIACDVSDLMQTSCSQGYNAVDRNDNARDDHGHGTHVAGTIAQSTNNNIGGVGVAFGVRLLSVKVLARDGSGTNASVAAGIHWAADNGAQVINMSLGGPMASEVIHKACKYASKKGVIIVAAAGNDSGAVGYPAAYPEVIAVSATDQNNKIANFSSRGPEIAIGAPGVGIIQNTICDGGANNCEDFPSWNGTSMATPHVAGTVALLVGMGITNRKTVEKYLFASAERVDDNNAELYGAGIVRANASVRSFWIDQFSVRMLLAMLFAFCTARLAKRKGDVYSIKTKSFVAATLTTSVGLLFFLPLAFYKNSIIIELLGRPLGDWPVLFDINLQGYLPMANVFVPLAITALLLKVGHAGKWLGGLFVGTAAYLGSLLVLNNMVIPFGIMGTAWIVSNIALCMYIGSLLLQVKPDELQKIK